MHELGQVSNVPSEGQGRLSIYPELMEQSMKDTVFLCVVEIIVDAFQTKEIKLENHQAEII